MENQSRDFCSACWNSSGIVQLRNKYVKSIWWMPWRQEAMKDVLRCDKRRGAAKELWSDDLWMGKPTTFVVSCNEYIVVRSKPGELKYLSTRRKGNHRDSLSSDERTGTRPMSVIHNGNALEKAAIVGDSPVPVNQLQSSSRAGHVQSCLNMGRPRSKPKYSLPTDSELVPWGKG